MLLCVSYEDCTYHIVDLEKKTERQLCQGYSSRAQCARLAPSFNLKTFPYVLVKENKWICVLNVKTESLYRLVINDDKCANGKRLEFLPRKKAKDDFEKGSAKYIYFLTTGCTLLKDKAAKAVSEDSLTVKKASAQRSYVDNGSVRKYKVNEDIFLQLSKMEGS